MIQPEMLHVVFAAVGLALGWYLKHQSIKVPPDVLAVVEELLARKQQSQGHAFLQELLEAAKLAEGKANPPAAAAPGFSAEDSPMNEDAVRNRIKAHVRVRAGDVLPHELNPRTHSAAQCAALAALYAEIGFARSLLAYELPDGRLKLIDGHLRQDLAPDMEVEVEVLDVSDAEARVLLLSLDPLAQLADYDRTALDRLRGLTSTSSDAIANLWASIAQTNAAVAESLAAARTPPERDESIPEQFLILVECADEESQIEMLQRFQQEGLKCKALVS